MRIKPETLRRSEFLVVASVVVFAVGMVAVAADFGLDEVLAHLDSLSAELIIGLLALSALNYGLRAARWQLFARRLGMSIPFRRTMLYYIAGFALTTTPGKIGEVLRLWFLERCHGYRYARATPLLVGDRVGDLNATLVLCVIGLSAFDGYIWLGIIAAIGLFALPALLLKPDALLKCVTALYGSVRRGKRLFASLRTALRHTARLFDPRLYAIALAIGIAGWFAESYALYWLLEQMGAEITLRQAIFIFSFSMLVGAVSMLPGGLGSTEATMFFLLVATGADADIAIAATAVIRLTTMWFAVILGFAALPAAMRLARAGRQDRPAMVERLGT